MKPLLSAVLLLALPALADEAGAPADVIKYRQAVMKSLGGHSRALGSLAQKKVGFPRHAEVHARAVADLAKLAAEVFPAGTGPAASPATDAKEEVWKEPKKFAAAMTEFQEKADAVLKASQGDGAGLKAAMEALGDSCQSCHKTFKKKD